MNALSAWDDYIYLRVLYLFCLPICIDNDFSRALIGYATSQHNCGIGPRRVGQRGSGSTGISGVLVLGLVAGHNSLHAAAAGAAG